MVNKFNNIAVSQSTHPLRCAAENQITLFQKPVFGKLHDQTPDRVDHIFAVALLSDFAIDNSRKCQLFKFIHCRIKLMQRTQRC